MTGDPSYEEVLFYLYERLPMFSKYGKEAVKNSLDNILKLCEALGNPQDHFKSVHIAGTNGKGSTSHMLAAVCHKAGYKTGLYTSPHLVDFRERIRIAGLPVSKEWVVGFVTAHLDLIEDIEPSFFEITVAMAFQAFREAEIDIAVIETGLGGRLDSTNIITPVLSIITNISFDHKDFLGTTLPQIAAEKAGIIKEGVPVLLGEQQAETDHVFFEAALHKHSTVYHAQSLWDLVKTEQKESGTYYKAVDKARREIYELHTDLSGSYQRHNIRTVLSAVEVLNATEGFGISIETTINALEQVRYLTGLRGRWERVSEQPLIVADVAHNPAGLAEVMAQWNQTKAERKHIIVGFVKDKEVDEALTYFPRDNHYYFCQAAIPRALPADQLETLAIAQGLAGETFPSVKEALEAVRK
ncbi:MAG: bifunctional folylpolyglutamate synthase/dihydrofolate synthase, partial [Sphingobacteriales bacterium]